MSRLQSACPYLFLILALASSLFLAWNLPPFQGADELAHLHRANLASFGRVIGERVGQGGRVMAGGPADKALFEADEAFSDVKFHPDIKANAADYNAAALARWNDDSLPAEYPGAAVYPPFLYLPASAALVAGRAFDWPVVQTLYVARMLNALSCAVLGFFALTLAGRSRLFLYAVLLLPMTVALYATVTTDGLLIAFTALGCAFVCRAQGESRPLKSWEILAAAECFALVGMTKPPYALVALVLLAAPAEQRRWRAVATAGVFVVTAAWTAWMAVAVQTPLEQPGVVLDPGRQAAFLLGHPAMIFRIAVETLSANWLAYSRAFVGVLGWLDTVLPEAFYSSAWAMLGLAAVVSWRGAGRQWRPAKLATLAVWVGIFALIHGALYVAWTSVGAMVVQGVAGRYFLPLAVLLSVVLEGNRPPLPVRSRVGRSLANLATVLVLAFPMISLLVVERAVILRYYLD